MAPQKGLEPLSFIDVFLFLCHINREVYVLANRQSCRKGVTMKVLIRFFSVFFMSSLFFSSLIVAKTTLQIVDNKRVCMVTNMVFPKDQIPVNHEGKTYYGCCENCKKTLSEDATARVATDPVSDKKIDKASAVIAARDDGSVIYFESRKTFNKYKKSLN